jgi:hypothetical protein
MDLFTSPLEDEEMSLRELAMPSMEDIEIQKSDLMLATIHYEVKPGIIKLVATKPFRGLEDDNPKLLAWIKALREAGLRAEHMAFSFMKHRVQPLMARDTLGFEYTGDDDTSWMPGEEVDDDDIVDRLARIFKDMPPYTACPVPEYSARTRQGR